MKSILKNKVTKYLLIVCLVLGAGSGGYLYYRNSVAANAAETNTTESTVKVARGDLSVNISGTGTVEPIARYEIVPMVTGTIVSAPFEEGSQVKAGNLLYKFDANNVAINIEKTKNSMAKLEINSDKTYNDLNNLEVVVPFDGRIINFSKQEGEHLNNNSTIAEIVNDETLVAKIPFNKSQLENIQVGQSAQLVSSEYMWYLDGKVISKSDSGTSNADGSVLYNVEIEIANHGGIQPGIAVNGIVKTAKGDMMSAEEGMIDYSKKQTFNIESSGTVTKVFVDNNQKVKAGQKILELKNDDLLTEQQKNSLDLKDLQLSLESQQQQLEEYSILSPIDGVVISKDTKVGDTINSKDNNVMMVVADMSQMIFTLEIDELDIAKVKMGQKVKVEADALLGEKFEGEVTKIAAEGTSSDGVTTYKVEVTISDYGNLRSGMNVNAEILVESKADVLYLPMAAVQQRNDKVIVFVKNEDSSKKAQPVEVGINNNEYIEIISGLNEGDEVVMTYKVATQAGDKANNRMMGGSIPGMGGSMPRGANNRK